MWVPDRLCFSPHPKVLQRAAFTPRRRKYIDLRLLSYSIVADSTSNVAEPESYSIVLDGIALMFVSQRGASVTMMGQGLLHCWGQQCGFSSPNGARFFGVREHQAKPSRH